MPFMIQGDVAIGERLFTRGTVVDDATGTAAQAEHPALVTRIDHDSDLCAHMVDGCDHESHDWNTQAKSSYSKPAPAPAVSAGSEVS